MNAFFGTWRLVPEINNNFDIFCDELGIPETEREIYRNAIFVIEISGDGLSNKMRTTIEGAPGAEEFKWEGDGLYPSRYRGRNGEEMATTVTMVDGKLVQRIWHLDYDVVWVLEAKIEGDAMILTQCKNEVELIQRYEKVKQ